MEFKNPYMFLLLALLIPYIIWFVLRHKKSHPALKLPETEKYRYVRRSFRTLLIPVPNVLRIAVFILVVICLARPQSKSGWSETDVEGIDIMLAVDVSTSMLAQDFKPNRVEALKEVAKEFVDKRPNDNIGLTFFAGEAFTQCPLTTDHTTLMNQYTAADDLMAAHGVINDGTAIGDGIMNALLRLRESKTASKVIIMLTDGVSNTGTISPLTAAEIAKMDSVRIYTIGIGRNGMAPYPLPTGGTAMVPVEIDETTMRQISEETGGKYFRAQKNTDLSEVYKEIDQMERSKLNVKQFNKYEEHYEPFALAALVLFVMELLLRFFVLRRIP